MENNNINVTDWFDENRKITELLSKIESILPDKEFTFDFTDDIFKGMLISQILKSDSYSIESIINTDLINKFKESKKSKEENERTVFGIIIFLILWLSMKSGNSAINSDLLIIETEDINTTITTTKVINFSIFNDENNKPYTVTEETTTTTKLITKFCIKDTSIITSFLTEYFKQISQNLPGIPIVNLLPKIEKNENNDLQTLNDANCSNSNNPACGLLEEIQTEQSN